MDICASLNEVIRTPSAAFHDPLNEAFRTRSPDDCAGRSPDAMAPLHECRHNDEPMWRIDGIGAFGTHFLTVPLFLNPMMKFDTFVSDWFQDSSNLRKPLHRCPLVRSISSSDEESGMACRVLQALEDWSHTQERLNDKFTGLPFGSHIFVDGVLRSPSETRTHIIPAYELERQMLSIDSLQSMWAPVVTRNDWPAIVDLQSLDLQRQIKDSIGLVRFVEGFNQDVFIFKSSMWEFRYLYHELKVLLTLPPHPNIMQRPKYVVTNKCRFGGKTGVCGFLLPFYPLGSINDVMSLRAVPEMPSLFKRLSWAIQITLALLHLKEHAHTYYSDLRLDNILVSASDGTENIVITDFEQRGNWFAWSPPELNYIVYLQQLATSKSVPAEKRAHYAALLRSINCGNSAFTSTYYQNPAKGYNDAWNVLSVEQQESATVFMLGIMLWCLFEGFSTISSLPWIRGSSQWTLQFPSFEATPPRLRALIQSCTTGAPEHEGRYSGVVRRGDKLFPRGYTETDGEGAAPVEETLAAVKTWWQEEIRRMEHFFDQAIVHEHPDERDECVFSGEPFFKRPTLRHVLEVLQTEERDLTGRATSVLL